MNTTSRTPLTLASSLAVAFALLAVLVLAALVLAGCAGGAASASTSRTETIAYVISPTTGAPELPWSELDADLARLDSEGDRLIVVVADGAPYVAIDLTLTELPGNSDDRVDKLKALRAQAATAITSQRAVTAEADVTEAIALVAQAVTPGTRTTIVITGSGLQTTGALSMLDGRLYAEPADLVTAAAQQGQVVDLSGVAEVRMPRLGVTTSAQPALDEGARTALTAIWQAYFARAGAASVDLTPTDLRAGDPVVGAPVVTPVDVRRPVAAAVGECRQVLGTSTIGFAADSAEFVDPAAAAAVVRDVYAALAGCTGAWIVEGSASSEGSAARNEALSLARAEAVAQLLRALAPDAEIQSIGWGAAWPCRTPDLDAQGALILDAAIANRVVAIGRGTPQC